MQAPSKRLKQRAYEAIVGPGRRWGGMLAGKRARASVPLAAATAVCLTFSSTAPALLEGGNDRPMDVYSDHGSGLGGLRDLFPDDTRQSVGVFAGVGYASSASNEPARYDCMETPEISATAGTASGSASTAPTNGIICLGAHDAIEFHQLRGNADRGAVELAMDVVPSSVRSHIADDQLFVSASVDDGSASREILGQLTRAQGVKPEEEFGRVDLACAQSAVFAHNGLLSLRRTVCSVVSKKGEVFRRRVGHGFRSERSVRWSPATQGSSAHGGLVTSVGRPRRRGSHWERHSGGNGVAAPKGIAGLSHPSIPEGSVRRSPPSLRSAISPRSARRPTGSRLAWRKNPSRLKASLASAACARRSSAKQFERKAPGAQGPERPLPSGSTSPHPSGSTHREASISSGPAVAPSDARFPSKRDVTHRTDHVLPGPDRSCAPYSPARRGWRCEAFAGIIER